MVMPRRASSSPVAPPAIPAARRDALRRRLLAWYRAHRRDLPWRRTRDPYTVWVAETMLQQTRVAAVIPYFERFLAEFPDLASLAQAPEERVLARWSGLGYYSRARNLQRAARVALEHHGGHLPSDPEALAALPGIGRYTLGAVLSIAFDRPWPVVDGNVVRVLARLEAMGGDPRRAPGADRLWRLAAALVPPGAPGDFNQALMELGATVCTPRAPRCGDCPVAALCRARAAGDPEAYPARRPRPAFERVAVVAALVESPRGVWLERRATGANRGLADVPAVESAAADGGDPAELQRRLEKHLAARGIRVARWAAAGSFRHGIMQRSYAVTVLRGRARAATRATGGEWMPHERLGDAPLAARARKAVALLRCSRPAGRRAQAAAAEKGLSPHGRK
jgi:A/G-specific adenine glycosylase